MDYFEKEREKINVLNAYETRLVSNLNAILKNLQTKELMQIASRLNIKYESINKEFLINSLLKEMLDINKIENVLVLTRDFEFDFFTDLLCKDYIQDNLFPYGYSGFLQDNYIIFSFYGDRKIYFLVPEEIKKIYSKIDQPRFLKKHKRYKQINQYLHICLNLYGAFKKKNFIEIFNHYNDEKLKPEEFFAVLDALLSRQQMFYEDDDFIACDYFEDDNFVELESLLKYTDEIPFYMPSKDKFLKFEDDGYFEMIPQLQNLKDFILNNMSSNEQDVDYLIDDIEIICSMEESFQDILNEFERHNIIFENTSQLNKIIPLIIDIYNNVRTWSNRGHTYCEMSKITGKSLPDWDFDEHLYIPMKNNKKPSKISRNDPCPCGSGKKYKKCCG